MQAGRGQPGLAVPLGCNVTPPPVFFQRVRKMLTGKGLLKHSFLKSVEKVEKEGFIFSLFLQKSERVSREKKAGLGVAGSFGRDELLRFTENYSMLVLFVNE
jgi:hypothetical protein